MAEHGIFWKAKNDACGEKAWQGCGLQLQQVA
jgi:hypothetical protein